MGLLRRIFGRRDGLSNRTEPSTTITCSDPHTVSKYGCEITLSSEYSTKEVPSSPCKFLKHDIWSSLGRNRMDDFVVIDCETTGFNRKADAIVELGVIKYSGGHEVEVMSTLVNPNRPIPRQATQVNGITDAMVKDAPSIDVVIPNFVEFIGDCTTLVAHNAPFDLAFIGRHMKKQGHTFDYTYIDTLPLCRKQFPLLPNHKLATIADHLGISGNWHRSEEDARATGLILLKCISAMEASKSSEYTEEEIKCVNYVKQILIANGKRWDKATCYKNVSKTLNVCYNRLSFVRIKLYARKRYINPCINDGVIKTNSEGYVMEAPSKSDTNTVRINIQNADDVLALEPVVLHCLSQVEKQYTQSMQYIDRDYAMVI